MTDTSIKAPPQILKVWFEKHKVVLGSSSVWRKKVLDLSGCQIAEVIAPDIDEKAIRGNTPRETCLLVARAKVQAIREKIPQDNQFDFAFCSDQVAVCDKEMREKPVDKAEAMRFLCSYSDGKPVETHTAVVLWDIKRDKMTEGIHTASAAFREIPIEIMDSLTNESSPLFTCAGGFCVDWKPMGDYCVSICGGVDSILGMPFELMLELSQSIANE